MKQWNDTEARNDDERQENDQNRRQQLYSNNHMPYADNLGQIK